MDSAFLNQGDNLHLRDLIDLPVLKEISEHILKVYGLGVVVASADGKLLVESASAGNYLGAFVADQEGMANWGKFVEKMAASPPRRGQFVDHELSKEAFFRTLPIMKDLEVIGIIALGPFSWSNSNPLLPCFLVEDFKKISRFLSSLFDVLVFSNYKRHLTNLAHLESITESYRQLETANQELQESYEKLKEIDQMKSNFLAVVSHELRTPLTSVIGYSEMLLEGLAGELNDGQKNYVRVIMEKGDQLLNLIREILNLSKIESGKMKVTLQKLDPREVADLALETIRPVAERRSIALSRTFAQDVPPVANLDREKLLQIYNNLLSNAVKFTPDGGSVELALRQNSSPEGNFLFSAVVDSGIGIPAEHLDKIFNKFYQVDNSSTRAYGGTGLGLTITKSFVEMHGGRIWVESEVEKGTKIFFTVRMYEDEEKGG